MRYETYRDEKSLWRWRAFALNGDLAAESITGYNTREACESMMDLDRQRRLNRAKIKEVPKKKEKSLLQRIREFIWGSED